MNGSAEYYASQKDVQYWKNQNLPFLILRVVMKDGVGSPQVFWRLIGPDIEPGKIVFQPTSDVLDRDSAKRLAELVDERHLRDSATFRRQLGRISLQNACDDLESGRVQIAIRGCIRAIAFAKLASDIDLLDEAHLVHLKCRERLRVLGLDSDSTGFDESRTGLIQERIWRCIDLLAAPEASDIKHGVEVLGSLGGLAASVVSELVPLVSHDDSEVRKVTVSALGRIGSTSDKVVDCLIKATMDAEWQVVHAGWEALKALGKELVISLNRAMNDPEDRYRLRAAEIAVRLDLDLLKAFELVSTFLAPHFGCSLRRRAAGTLRYHFAEKASPIVKTIVDQLISALDDIDVSVRIDSAWALGLIGDDAQSSTSTLKLLSLLSDEAAEVRRAAAIAIGRIGVPLPSVSEALTLLLQDEHQPYDVRREAALALASLFRDSPATSAALWQQLDSQNSSVRAASAKAFSHFVEVPNGVVRKLAMLLRDPDVMVRSEVASTLATLGGAAAECIPALIEALDDEHRVSDVAAQALGNLGSLAASALPHLERMPSRGAWGLPSSSYMAIRKIKGESDSMDEFLFGYGKANG